MFTGIVQHIARVEKNLSGSLVLSMPERFGPLLLGESIAVNGVCLTLESFDCTSMHFGVGPESARVTTTSQLLPGQLVHIERALSLSDLVGGHLVQGHVDGVGTVCHKKSVDKSLHLAIECAAELTTFFITKGSVTVNGISLTINSNNTNQFEVCLIPYTLANTLLRELNIGDAVNIECDMIAKYIHRFSQPILAQGVQL